MHSNVCQIATFHVTPPCQYYYYNLMAPICTQSVDTSDSESSSSSLTTITSEEIISSVCVCLGITSIGGFVGLGLLNSNSMHAIHSSWMLICE